MSWLNRILIVAVAVMAIIVIVDIYARLAPAVPTAQSVIDALRAAGLAVDNPTVPERGGDALPNTYRERILFQVPGARPGRGGQILTCDTKKNCDALYAYFDMLKGLVGPYIYQSPDGLVVVQMNSGLTPDIAAQYETVIKALP
jgi:hypothetical protein